MVHRYAEEFQEQPRLGQAQLAQAKPGTSPTYTFEGDELYVRAEIMASKKKANPYAAGEHERAWLQPVRPRK